MALVIKNDQINQGTVKELKVSDYISYQGSVFLILNVDEDLDSNLSNVVNIQTGAMSNFNLVMVLGAINDQSSRDNFLIKDAEFNILVTNK